MDILNYNLNRGIYSPLVEHNGNVCGFWLVGNDYRNKSKLYGAYPPSYLKRIYYLFPKAQDILHLFSGSVKPKPGETRFDISDTFSPDIKGDAEEVGDYFPENSFDLVLADPPYDDNHIKYGTKKCNKVKVLKSVIKILKPNGFLVWLDTILPIYSKADGWKYRGSIGLLQSTNHKVRVASFLQKVSNGQ